MTAQLEDGYTRTANELLERLMKIKLNGTQHNIIYCIIRNTYGFQRKSHPMSLTFISAAIEAHKDLVKRELDKLIENNVVRVFKDGDYTHSREIGMNKNTSEWKVDSKPISRQSTKQSTVGELVGEQSPNQSTPTVDQSVYQERKSFKEIKEISTTEILTLDKVHEKVFGTLFMNGLMSDFIIKTKKKGYTEAFLIELMLEVGESGTKPNIRFMETICDRWIEDGIYTRAENQRRKESEKKSGPYLPNESEALNAKRLSDERKEHIPRNHEPDKILEVS